MSARAPLLLCLLALAGGCKPAAKTTGVRATCSCTYLTDFDDTAKIDLDFCAPDGREVEKEATYCAAESAHNHIDRCTCTKTKDVCDPKAKDACRTR